MAEPIYIADKITLDNVNTKIGITTDTGGSETTGSLMGKINQLINSQQNNTLTEIRPSFSNAIGSIPRYSRTTEGTTTKAITFTPSVNGKIMIDYSYILSGSGMHGDSTFTLKIDSTAIFNNASDSSDDYITGSGRIVESVAAGTPIVISAVLGNNGVESTLGELSLFAIGNNGITEGLGTVAIS